MIPIDNKTPDWNRIKSEYISGVDSLRSLSRKYDVSWSTLRQRAYREKWGAERKKVQTKVEQSVVKETTKKAVDNATLAADIKRKGLLILSNLFDEFANIKATEHREYNENNLTDIKKLRDLTAAYKDLTEDITQAEASNGLLESMYELERRYHGD